MSDSGDPADGRRDDENAASEDETEDRLAPFERRLDGASAHATQMTRKVRSETVRSGSSHSTATTTATQVRSVTVSESSHTTTIRKSSETHVSAHSSHARLAECQPLEVYDDVPAVESPTEQLVTTYSQRTYSVAPRLLICPGNMENQDAAPPEAPPEEAETDYSEMFRSVEPGLLICPRYTGNQDAATLEEDAAYTVESPPVLTETTYSETFHSTKPRLVICPGYKPTPVRDEPEAIYSRPIHGGGTEPQQRASVCPPPSPFKDAQQRISACPPPSPFKDVLPRAIYEEIQTPAVPAGPQSCSYHPRVAVCPPPSKVTCTLCLHPHRVRSGLYPMCVAGIAAEYTGGAH